MYWLLESGFKLCLSPVTTVCEISERNIDCGIGQESRNMLRSCIVNLHNPYGAGQATIMREILRAPQNGENISSMEKNAHENTFSEGITA